MPETFSPHEADALIQGYMEGALTADEAARLLALLKERPALNETLLAELRLDAQLREVCAAAGQIASQPSVAAGPAEIVRPDFFRQRPVAWLALAAALVALAVPAFQFFNAPAARLVAASGEVTVLRGGASLPARAGMELRVGDAVRTAVGAAAEIGFRRERTRLSLTNAAELALNQLDGGRSVELRRGTVAAVVAPQTAGRPLMLATRQALATVTGTRLTLAARRNGAWLRVEEGRVELRKLDSDEPEAVVPVSAGEFAVAAAGVALAARPAAGAFESLRLPLAVVVESGMPTGFGAWEPADGGVRQTEVARAPNERQRPDGTFDRSKPNLYSFFYLPVATAGDFRLSATVDLHETTADTRSEQELNAWRFGLGLRFPEHEIGLHVADNYEPGRDEHARLRTRCLIPEWNRFISVPLMNAPDARVVAKPGGSFRLLWEVRRVGKATLHLRGKFWPVGEREPAEWTVDATTDSVEGPLGAVTFETYRAACTFRGFKAELLP